MFKVTGEIKHLQQKKTIVKCFFACKNQLFDTKNI